MVSNSQIRYGFINVVDPTEHKGELTLDGVERYTDSFAKPALFRRLAPIAETLSQRSFFDRIDPEKTLQWRVKTGDQSVSMRSEEGHSDYNYVSERVGSGRQFLGHFSKIDRQSRSVADTDEPAHFLTSINYASRHLNRAQMILNDVEYAYLRTRGGNDVHIGHQ